MATRLLIRAMFMTGLMTGLTACASQPVWYDQQTGLVPGPDETVKDHIRDVMIQRYFQAPHDTRLEPDVARMRARQRLGNDTDPVAVSGGLDPTEIRLFFAKGTSMGTVIDTLARSMGYEPRFTAPWVRDRPIPEPIRGAHDVADVAAWLTERMNIPITVWPEARLVMVYKPRGAG